MQPFATKWGDDVVETTLERLVVKQSATADIASLRGDGLNTFEGSDGVTGKTRVVAPLHDRVDGVDTEYGHLGILVNGQHVVFVVQQHDTLAGSIEGQLPVGVASHEIVGQFGPGIKFVAVKVAQLDTCDEQPSQTLVEVGLLDVTATYGSRQVLILRTAL